MMPDESLDSTISMRFIASNVLSNPSNMYLQIPCKPLLRKDNHLYFVLFLYPSKNLHDLKCYKPGNIHITLILSSFLTSKCSISPCNSFAMTLNLLKLQEGITSITCTSWDMK